MNTEHKGIYCPKEGRFCSVELDELSTVRADTIFISHDNRIDKAFLDKIKNKIEENGLIPISFNRHDVTSEFYCNNICKEIRDCAFVIADLSFWDADSFEKIKDKIKSCTNPNVAMEIGLSYAFQKDVILLVREEQFDKILSNIQGVSVSKYNFEPLKFNNFLAGLESKIKSTKDKVLIRRKVELIYDFEEMLNIILQFEKDTNFRYFLRDRFDVITYPENLLDKSNPEGIKQKRQMINLFKECMNRGGVYKDIVSKQGIEKYLREEMFFSKDELKSHVENVISLLNTYHNYSLALVENEIPLMMEITEKAAWIHKLGGSYDIGKENLKAIVFTTRGVVDGLKREFEIIWNEKDTVKEKTEVISCLKKAYEELLEKEVK